MPPNPSATTEAFMVVFIVAGSVGALAALVTLAVAYVRHRRASSLARGRRRPPPKRPTPERRVAFLRPAPVPSAPHVPTRARAAPGPPRGLGAGRQDASPAERRAPAFHDAHAARAALSPGAWELEAPAPPPWPLRDDGAPVPAAHGRSRETLGPRRRPPSPASVSSYVTREASSDDDDDYDDDEMASQPVTDSPTPLSLPRASHSRDALLSSSAAESPALPTPLRVPHARDALLDRSAFGGLGGAYRNTFGQGGGVSWGA